jgi:hypothetical protein
MWHDSSLDLFFSSSRSLDLTNYLQGWTFCFEVPDDGDVDTNGDGDGDDDAVVVLKREGVWNRSMGWMMGVCGSMQTSNFPISVRSDAFGERENLGNIE